MAPGISERISDLAGSFRDNSISEPIAKVNGTKKSPTPHPLDALSEDEVTRVGLAVKKHFTEVSELVGNEKTWNRPGVMFPNFRPFVANRC